MTISQLLSKIDQIESDNRVTDKDRVLVDEISVFISSISSGKSDLLKEIGRNHNLLGSSTIDRLIEKRVLSEDDILRTKINPLFLNALGTKLTTKVFDQPADLTQISRLSTEIYFWGIPASGKSCAIGAILSMASKGYIPQAKAFVEHKCQGYDYMMQLCEMFIEDGHVKPLPMGTPVRYTYEMSFDIIDDKHRVHPITFIDMAGELIRCMYKKNAGQNLTDEEEKALKTVTDLLMDNRSKNQKLHFFVLEYDGHNRSFGNLTQLALIRGAITYLNSIPTSGNNGSFNVFEEKTDGIYLLVTKVDKAGVPLEQLKTHLEEYIHGPQGYQGIGNLLQEICEKHNINNRELEIVPFSLGEVCFKNYCIFDGRHTADIIDILVTRTWHYSEWLSKWWALPIKWIINFLKS